MSDDEREQGKWQGKIESTQESHGKRISRLEAAILAVLVAAATIGAKSVGLF